MKPKKTQMGPFCCLKSPILCSAQVGIEPIFWQEPAENCGTLGFDLQNLSLSGRFFSRIKLCG